jgi:3-deoxy-D-arabino-heptulosonate 7-phosphate (DAHP) synthase class II
MGLRHTLTNVLHSAAYILNGERCAEFLAMHAEANRLHTEATALRREAWAIYHDERETVGPYA